MSELKLTLEPELESPPFAAPRPPLSPPSPAALAAPRPEQPDPRRSRP